MNEIIVIGGGVSAWAAANAFSHKNIKINLIYDKEISFGAQQISPNGLKSYVSLTNNKNIFNKIEKINNLKINNYNDILFVNLKVPAILTKIISKNMIKKKEGKIINISSIFGSVSKSQRSSYSSSKFGLIGLTKSSSLDLAKYNIMVNSVSPGFIKTKLTKKILKEKGIKKISKIIPMNRLGNVKEISNLVNFLSSKYNTYITGQNIIIDGGFTSE